MKLNPLVSSLSLYDIAGTPCIAANVNHINTKFEVDYAFLAHDINENLRDGKTILRTILMLCTGDHPAQCKLGQLKDGGTSFSRREKPKATQIEDSSGKRYVYDENKRQGGFPPKKKKVEDMW